MNFSVSNIVRRVAFCQGCGRGVESCDVCGEWFGNGERVYCRKTKHLCSKCFRGEGHSSSSSGKLLDDETRRVVEDFMEGSGE